MTWLDPRLWLVIGAAGVIGSATGYFKGHADGVRTTTAAAQKAQLDAVAAARTEEQRRTAAQQEIAEDAAKQRDRARADAVAAASASAAADGLRKQVAVLVERGRHPTPTAGSAPTGDALDLLADVLGRADTRAGELAEYADRARIAGEQCERDYAALTRAND
ncbi:hypothetical protein WS67_12240 [Burkholderia singularis]|uniref:Gp23 n=1 Tax=Burkholderia singularis TaxID=1503053 RepID=A0A124P935_9BURK|nr:MULTISPECIES: DUF2514 family protein [Burkholderia]KVE27263.1 hypothetical protein WS67_12240 [Burkholderia singularis]KVE33756.1 hypothetical protein WS68_11330 [Burkholderia sp. TSV86]